MHLTGFSVGHYTDPVHETGLTVFLCDERSPCSYFICGSAPALREVSVLDVSLYAAIDALVFSGGSAFGLGAANGVMQWLSERKRGLQVFDRFIPIVPSASIFDRGIFKHNYFPSIENAYAACEAATSEVTARGSVGAGAGASVGMGGLESQGFFPMRGGLGYAEARGSRGLFVGVFAVANPFGDVYDGEKIIAGLSDKSGKFINVSENLDTVMSHARAARGNSILVAVLTNARFDERQLAAIAKMGSSGIAKAVAPAFTALDGDVVFAVSGGDVSADVMVVGNLAAQLTRAAIMDAVNKQGE